MQRLEELVALLGATHILCCDTTKMCYNFGQIFPFHSELRKDKIATRLLLPPAVFLSPYSFWEARDQPEPGSFFPRMKDPGNEVAKKVQQFAVSTGTKYGGATTSARFLERTILEASGNSVFFQDFLLSWMP